MIRLTLVVPARSAGASVPRFPEAIDTDAPSGWAAGEWAGRPIDDVAHEHAEDFGRWRTDPSFAPSGGESLDAFLARVGAWLDSLPDGRLEFMADATVVAATVDSHARGDCRVVLACRRAPIVRHAAEPDGRYVAGAIARDHQRPVPLRFGSLVEGGGTIEPGTRTPPSIETTTRMETGMDACELLAQVTATVDYLRVTVGATADDRQWLACLSAGRRAGIAPRSRPSTAAGRGTDRDDVAMSLFVQGYAFRIASRGDRGDGCSATRCSTWRPRRRRSRSGATDRTRSTSSARRSSTTLPCDLHDHADRRTPRAAGRRRPSSVPRR